MSRSVRPLQPAYLSFKTVKFDWEHERLFRRNDRGWVYSLGKLDQGILIDSHVLASRGHFFACAAPWHGKQQAQSIHSTFAPGMSSCAVYLRMVSRTPACLRPGISSSPPRTLDGSLGEGKCSVGLWVRQQIYACQ